MIKNLIISDHKLLQSNKNKNIFIGEWCVNTDKLNVDKNKKYKIIKYHWNDKKKINKDLKYLLKLHNFIIKKLYGKLNKFHNTNYPLRYWETILSYWLWIYLVFHYDRWKQIFSIKNLKNIQVKILNFKNSAFIPLDTKHFCSNVSKNDWNHWSFSQIIKFSKKIKFKYINKSELTPNLFLEKKFSNKKLFLSKILNLISTKTYFSINVFFGNILNIIFSILFKEMRLDSIFSNNYKNLLIDIETRKKFLKIKINKLSKFEDFIFHNITYNLPKSFFENFKNIENNLNNLNLPKSPKAISTASEHILNDKFKIYAASKIMKGSKYYIFQHGGSYGTSDFFPNEFFDIKLADKFFSWGWKKEKKITPFYCTRNLYIQNIKKKNLNKQGLIIPFTEMPLALGNLQSGRPRNIMEIDSYVETLKTFYTKLETNIKKASVFKGVQNNINELTYIEDSLKYIIKNSKFIKSDKNTYKFLYKYKLYVETLNSTGYLESLSLNLPTLLIFNKKFCDIRKNAKKDFNDLKKVNILFNNPINAANFINKNYNNLEEWWSNPELQRIRKFFCYKYVRKTKDPFKNFKKILKNA